jgi:hypothetical protein
MNNQFPCYQTPKKDIVDILLDEWEAAKMDTPYGLPAFKEGADEIVRLREENERLRNELTKFTELSDNVT